MSKKEGSPQNKKRPKDVDEALLENFINLQKVLTNLAVKFEELSGNMSKLLQLFEISAQTFAEKYSGNYTPTDSDRELLRKLDSLLEQNKVISKGIMLMEEKIRERNPQAQEEQIRDTRVLREPLRRPFPRY